MESSFGALAALEKQKAALQEKKLKLEREKDNLTGRVTEALEKLKIVETKQGNVEEDFQRMGEMETAENKK